MFLKFEIKNSEQGITLVELVVSIVIITVLTLIMVTNFPAILRKFAVSRATYKLAQDLRYVQDLGLSGVDLKNGDGDPLSAKGGYGIYIDTYTDNTKYILYADLGGVFQQYDNNNGSNLKCEAETDSTDCIIDVIDISKEEQGVYISSVENADTGDPQEETSINFTPPNPTTTIIDQDLQIGESGVDIVVSSKDDDSVFRTVSVNSSGLIEVK